MTEDLGWRGLKSGIKLPPPHQFPKLILVDHFFSVGQIASSWPLHAPVEVQWSVTCFTIQSCPFTMIWRVGSGWINSSGNKRRPGKAKGNAIGMTQGNNFSLEGLWQLQVPPQGHGRLGPLLLRLFICINILHLVPRIGIEPTTSSVWMKRCYRWAIGVLFFLVRQNWIDKSPVWIGSAKATRYNSEIRTILFERAWAVMT